MDTVPRERRSSRSRSTTRRSLASTGVNTETGTRSKGNQIEPLHPSVAVSDAFMASCAWYSAWRINGSGLALYVQLGFICFGLACSAGTLRFGFNPETFRPYNEVLAKNAGRVGVPLLAFVAFFAAMKWDEKSAPSLLLAFCISSACSNLWSEKVQKLYTIATGVLGNICLVLHGGKSGACGAALFVLGGLVIGSDRHRFVWGVRRENLFHYCLGTALLLIGEHVAAQDTWKLSSLVW